MVIALTMSNKEYLRTMETVLFARIIALIWTQNPGFTDIMDMIERTDDLISDANKNIFFDELKK